MYEFKNKKVLIIGMARSGIKALDVMLDMGSIVSLQDQKEINNPELLEKIKENNIETFFGKLPKGKYDYLVVSPGVNPEQDYIQNMIKEGSIFLGELELAYLLTDATFIGITGTNGKTTTTTLVGEMFKNGNMNSSVCGNIGIPAITKAYENKCDFLVTEVSSYQLQTIKDFHCKVGAILNITPDHLDRHHTMENYINTKRRITENQDSSDYLVLNKDDELTFNISKNTKANVYFFSKKEELSRGAFLRGDLLILKDDKEYELINKNDLNIIGGHNIDNALCASLVSYLAGVPIDVIRKTLKEFKGVEHRIEYVRTLNGVKYYNDSKGTNVDATITAINAFPKNIILILGGDSKGQTFSELVKHFNGKVKYITFLGRDAHFIIDECDKIGFKNYSYHNSLKECVEYAYSISKEGDVVLLSPACASWDMYKNFEVRGEEFKTLVNNL